MIKINLVKFRLLSIILLCLLNCVTVVYAGDYNSDVVDTVDADELLHQFLDARAEHLVDADELLHRFLDAQAENPKEPILKKQSEQPRLLYDSHPDLKQNPLDGRTPFWGQEVVGAGLFQWPESKVLHPVKVGVFDGDVSDHEEKVTSLINYTLPVGIGIGPGAQVGSMAHCNRLDSFADLRSQIEVINLSISFPKDPPKFLVECPAIVVQSAGNGRPVRIPRVPGTILVGGLTVYGLMDGRSSQGKDVVIAAPGIGILTARSSGLEIADGTSFAAPMVTAALASVKAFIPNLNNEEAVFLLRRTAIRTANYYEVPQRNGAGMLNLYLLLRIVENLSKDLGWQKCGSDRLARMKHLQGDTVFDFRKEAQGNLEAAKILLSARPEARDERSALDHLRKAFHLDSSLEEARRLLEETYRKNGLRYNADFYESLKYPEGLKSVILKSLADPSEEFRDSALWQIRSIPVLWQDQEVATAKDCREGIDARAFALKKKGQKTEDVRNHGDSYHKQLVKEGKLKE